MAIRNFLEEHSKKREISFHMPGHKGSDIYLENNYRAFLDGIMDYDITEIDGADNLFKAGGIIKKTQDKYKKLYDVAESYLLINGTSGGLIAAILASSEKNDEIIIARNCHKAVFNALEFGDLNPIYAYPKLEVEWGLAGEVLPEEIERLLEENPKVKAVVITSPNYYGICSDIEKIAKITHERGKVLIVDQAHGAHLKFMKAGPIAAEDAGADIVINSTHKTLASFTQSAILNFNTNLVDKRKLEEKLQMIQSSSPSYILMASLDVNADIIEKTGGSLFDTWQKNIDEFYDAAKKIPGLKIIGNKKESTGMYEVGGKTKIDRTKINIDASSLGLVGTDLNDVLIANNIYSELYTGNVLMCMSGIGNKKEDYQKLLQVLSLIAKEGLLSGEDLISKEALFDVANSKKNKEELRFNKKRNFLWAKKREFYERSGKKEYLNIKDCGGRICMTSIIPYPPGIPLICPGEKIENDDIDYIKKGLEAGEKIIGIDENGNVEVLSKNP